MSGIPTVARLEPATRRALEARARAHGRKLSDELRAIVDSAIRPEPIGAASVEAVRRAASRRPRARRHDPDTSRAAAASVGDLRPRQAAVYRVLRERGPLTDEGIARAYTLARFDMKLLDGLAAVDEAYPPQSPSGLRTRRRELADAGLVRPTGERVRLDTGRSSRVWEVVT